MAVLSVLAVTALWRYARVPGVMLTSWVAVPTLMLGVLALRGSFFNPRYLSAVVPAVSVLVAVGAVVLADALIARLVRFERATPAVAVLIVVVVLAGLVPSALHTRLAEYSVDDPRSASNFVAASYRSGDAVIYAGSFARGLTTFYAPKDVRLSDPLLAETALQSDTTSRRNVPPEQQASAVADARRLWVVGTTSGQEMAGQEVADRVTEGRRREERKTFGGFVVELWGPIAG